MVKGHEGYTAFGDGSVVRNGPKHSSLQVLLRNHLSMINTASSLQATKFAHWRQASVDLALQSGQAVHAKDDALNQAPPNQGPEARWEGVKVAPTKDGRIAQI